MFTIFLIDNVLINWMFGFVFFIFVVVIVIAVGDRSWGWPEGSFFDSFNTIV